MDNIENIISKIKKLFALSNNNSNKEEAALAARKATELLQEYNLEMSVIESFNAERDNIIQQNIGYSGKIAVWKSILARILADNNFCKSIYMNTSKLKTLNFVGRSVNVQVVILLYNNIVSRLQILVDEDFRQYKATWGYEDGRSYKNSWYRGAVKGIKYQLELAKRDFAQKAGANALITLRQVEIDKFVAEEIGKLVSTRNTKVRINDAFASGFETGKNLEMQNFVNQRQDATLHSG